MNKTVLVTGAAGYVGSVVTEVLIDKGFKVIAVDNLSNGNEDAVDDALFITDFADTELLDWAFTTQKIDFVIHLAALANIPDSIVNPLCTYEENVSKTITLLDKMRQHSVKNILFTSSAAVFGEPAYQPIDEQCAKRPISAYGRSKLMIEEVLKDCCRAYGINHVIFRYLNVAGATEKHGESRPHESHLIPLVAKKALGGETPLCVYGDKFNTQDGTGVRDYFHVLDIADAHLLAMEKIDEVKGNSFNLGSGEARSVLQIIKGMELVSGVKIPYEIKPAREGDPSSLMANISKAYRLLGWSPKRSLIEMLESAYAWQKNRPY